MGGAGGLLILSGLCLVTIKGVHAFLRKKSASQPKVISESDDQEEDIEFENAYTKNKKTVDEKLERQTNRAKNEVRPNQKRGKIQFEQDIRRPALTTVKVHPSPFSSVGMAECKSNGSWRDMQGVQFAKKIIINEVEAIIFGLCEGKSGEYIKQNLSTKLQKFSKDTDDFHITDALVRTLDELNQELAKEEGTSLSIALVIDDRIFVANVGDSRVILIPNNNSYLQLSVTTPRTIGIGEKWRPKITRISRAVKLFEGGHLVFANKFFWKVASNDEVRCAIQDMKNENLEPKDMASRLAKGALFSLAISPINLMVVKID